MDHKDKVIQMLEAEPVCPYCGMGVSRIVTRESISAVCGWCDIRWTKYVEKIVERDELSMLIMWLPTSERKN